jgi:uncharacterized membrane protein YfcA
MARAIFGIFSVLLALGAAVISVPYLFAALRHPSTQDTPIWATLGTLAILASVIATQTFKRRMNIDPTALVLRTFASCALVLPAALFVGYFAIAPP